MTLSNSTTVSICNDALTTYLGAKSIASLEEPTPGAAVCALHFARARKQLLAMHDWTFARRRKKLVLISDNDRSSEWAFRYSYPSTATRLIWVNDPLVAREATRNDLNPDEDRELTTDSIYSNVPDAHAQYTEDVADITVAPVLFQDVLAAYLATKIGMSVSKNARFVRRAEEAFAVKLDAAITTEMQNQAPMTYAPYPNHFRNMGVPGGRG
jgi:hypothetical protein